MTKASDNPYPSILIEEHVDPTAPAAGHKRLFIDTDHKLKSIDSSSVVVDFTPTAATSSRPFLDTENAIDGTYGDDFDGASLDARWTLKGRSAGDCAFQLGGGSWMDLTLDTTQAEGYLQTAPGGDFTLTWAGSLTPTGSTTVDAEMVGPVIVDTNGSGIGVHFYYNSPGLYLSSISTYSYAAMRYILGLGAYGYTSAGIKMWLQINKTGTNYKGRFSYDGYTWSAWTTAYSDAFTVDRVGVLRVYGTAGMTIHSDLFNKS